MKMIFLRSSGIPPCLANRLNHLRSPLPFRLPLRSSPWQTAEKAAACTVSLLGQLAVAQNLDAVLALARGCPWPAEPQRPQSAPSSNSFESGHVDDLQGLGENVVEAALGNAARQRHLAAFKADADAAAGAGLLALVATAGGLTVAGAGAAALALGFLGGAGGGRQFMQFHPLAPPYSTSVTWSR